MAKIVRKKGSKTTYGPYEGSAQNKGRPVVIHYDKKAKPNPSGSKTTSRNAARDTKDPTDKLPRSKHVAHKPGTSRSATASSATTVTSASKNIGDGNKNRRKGK